MKIGISTISWKWLCAGTLIGWLSACSPAPDPSATSTTVPEMIAVPSVTASAAATFEPTETIMPLNLTSPGFKEGGSIPSDFACTGANQSPELKWTDPPDGTKSFALIFNDPDASSKGFVHWVIFNIPSSVRDLPAAIASKAPFDDGTIQGTNSWGRLGYGGPCPPQGSTHNYVFTLYALDAILDLGHDATREGLMAMMEGHVLVTAELSAKFGR